MKEVDISSIAVQIWATHRHRWQAGQTLHHLPARHHNSSLLYHLWLVRQGVVEVEAGGRCWRINSGEVCFLPVTLERHISTPAPAVWLSIGLRITLFNRFDLLPNLQLPAHWRPDDVEGATVDAWMEHIIQARQRSDAHWRLVVNGLSRALLGLCWPHLSPESLDSPVHAELPPWLSMVLRRISREPSCNISSLAQEAGLSPAQFRRAFHKWVGVAPRDYLKGCRMDAAQHLLETSDLPLRAIAMQVGFRDASHFSQQFKMVNGLSPSQHRDSFHTRAE